MAAALERAAAAGASPKLTAEAHALALSRGWAAPTRRVAVYRPWFERNRKSAPVLGT